jgi:hypothetical protein
MKPKLVNISEEIVRWSFEIAVNESKDWFIAFTNPTAGPWKRITAPNKEGKIGEIHRFEIDETRPDLILVNDKTHQILIIEAKTTFSDLQKSVQLAKTSQLFLDLTNELQNISDNEFWGARAGYEYLLGLLWSAGDETKSQIKETCKLYSRNISKITKDIICIEGFIENDILKSKAYRGVSEEKLALPS